MIINNPFKENFNGKRKFLKWIVNNCPKIIVNNPFKESFYGKRKFLKWIINHYPKGVR